MINRLLCTVLLWAFSAVSIAGPTMTTEVEKIRVRDWITYAKLKDCPYYAKLYLDSEYGKAMYSALLTAATAGKKVHIEFESADGCSAGETKLTFIEILY